MIQEKQRDEILELGAGKLLEALTTSDGKQQGDAIKLVNTASRFLTAAARVADSDGSDQEQEEAESPAA